MVKVSVNYTGNLHCDATHGPSQSKIATDAPADNKGKGEAFSPTDLVATALGACISTTMGIKAEELGVDLRGMAVSVQKEMSKDAPRRIVALPSEVHIPLPPDSPHRAVLEQTALNCPVHKSLPPRNQSPDEIFLGRLTINGRHPERSRGIPPRKLKLTSTGCLDCARDDSIENTKGNRIRYSTNTAVDARTGRVRKLRRRLCNYRGHSTGTGVPTIAARLLLSGCGRKREFNWAACLLLRRLHLSGKTKHRRKRALCCRRPSQQGRGKTLNESRCARGGARWLRNDQVVGRQME